MATCFYPTLAAEDFIPLPETTPPEQISRPSRRCHLKCRIIPEFCAAKTRTRDFNSAAASVPGNHHRKRSRDAIGDDQSSGDLFSVNHIPHKMIKASPSLGHEDAFEIQGHESEIDLLISQHTRRNRGACTCICRGARAPLSVIVVVVTVGRALGWKCKKERKKGAKMGKRKEYGGGMK